MLSPQEDAPIVNMNLKSTLGPDEVISRLAEAIKELSGGDDSMLGSVVICSTIEEDRDNEGSGFCALSLNVIGKGNKNQDPLHHALGSSNPNPLLEIYLRPHNEDPELDSNQPTTLLGYVQLTYLP